MSFGVQIFNSSGTLAWDSTTATGGVVADSRTYSGGQSATILYPSFAGRSAAILGLVDVTPPSVTVDTALGYPRVTVASAPANRQFYLLVW